MALNKKELAEALALEKQRAAELAKLSSSYDNYVKGLKESVELTKTIKKTEEERDKSSGDRRQILDEQLKILNKQNDALKEAILKVNGLKIVTGKMVAETVKGLANIPGMLNNVRGILKGSGLLEMDKAVKMSALQMGLLGKEGDSYAQSIRQTAEDTNLIGVGLEALAKMQGDYAEGLGRTVMLGDKGLKAMAQMSMVTGLGAEGTTQMAIDMEEVGYSAERTGEFVNKSMDDSHKMGINASKVIKNVQGNMKLLNKYNFKNGVKGLDSMAKLVTKLGIDMKFATGMADKLWDIEGAVDMSAQLQVMGGEWAKMADPFHLMYMARNDMEGLTKEIANASQASMHFGKNGKDIEMSSLEMSRLKIIAKETGLEYDDLVKSGKELFKMNAIKKQIGFGFDKDTQEFISNTAQIGENGKATIEIDGSTKLVSQLNGGDLSILKQQIAEKKSMEERAKASQTFDDKLTNLINQVKTYMLPIIDGINSTLSPIVEDFMKDETFKGELRDLGKNIGEFIGNLKPFFQIVSGIVKTLGPTGTLAAIFGPQILFNVAQWAINGVTLGQSFIATVSGEGALLSFAKNFAGIAGPLLAVGVGTVLGIKTGAEYSKSKGREDTKTGDVAGVVGGIAGGAGGWALGAALAPETFGLSLLIPLIAAGIGAYAGSTGGKIGGDKLASPVNDGFFPKPNLGSEFSKGRQIIQDGVATPIDNKDMFVAKPKGPIDNALNQKANIPSTINHTFEPIEIRGTLMVNTPGNPGQGVELLKNGEFIRNITSMIHSETQRQIGGGKNKG